MSPKFYTYLWIAFFAAAIVVFIAGAFTMFAGVVFGFVAFGLIFTGMMCVLPAQVGHEHHASHNTSDIESQPVKQQEARQISIQEPGVIRLRSV